MDCYSNFPSVTAVFSSDGFSQAVHIYHTGSGIDTSTILQGDVDDVLKDECTGYCVYLVEVCLEFIVDLDHGVHMFLPP